MFSAISKLVSGGKKVRKPGSEVSKISLGVCAMDKKARSKPMREILNRLSPELFDITIFGDDCILNQPVDQWPVVECLITFYSTHFPTERALQYIELRQPFLINDLQSHDILVDRRKIYEMLISIGVDVPEHIFVDRRPLPDGTVPTVEVEEFDDYIVVDGKKMSKPLVEKPFDAEDHNIYIYYPMSTGGGSKRLFRKVNDRSSEFYPTVNEIRRDGSFIYEEFLVTQGTDVKVYALGPNYAHAEARKSPVVDGRVNRDLATGLEVRYPVILSLAEKEMTRKITESFKQTVCGFDILRVPGKSYVCDVNGWSFVKNSRKYYDDASQVLAEFVASKLRPAYAGALVVLPAQVVNNAKGGGPVSPNAVKPGAGGASSSSGGTRLLQRPTAVVPGAGGESALFKSMRGGDNIMSGGNTPLPQVSAGHPASVGIAPSTSSAGTSVAGGSTPLNVPHKELMESNSNTIMSNEELRCVVAVMRHGDRTPKQKLKVMTSHAKYLEFFHHYAVLTAKKGKGDATKELKIKTRSALLHFLATTIEIIQGQKWDPNNEYYRVLRQIRDVLERYEISGINRKLQMKPAKWEVQVDAETGEGRKVATELLLIMKWGGNLTPLGREQAEILGADFRQYMYPDAAGGGVLRLHSTYRHDLKIKSSDEGRVMKTAAAFTKGLLELEGNLTPILASLVTVEEKCCIMLDKRGNALVKADMDRYHHHLNMLQLMDEDMTEEKVNSIAPECSASVKAAMFRLGNPRQALRRMHGLMEEVCLQLNDLCLKYEPDDDSTEDAAPEAEAEGDADADGGKYRDSSTGNGPSGAGAGGIAGGAAGTCVCTEGDAAKDKDNKLFACSATEATAPSAGAAATATDGSGTISVPKRPSSASSLERRLRNMSTERPSTPRKESSKGGLGTPSRSPSKGDLTSIINSGETPSVEYGEPDDADADNNDASDGQTRSKPRKKVTLYLFETHSMRRDRWEKIYYDFYDAETDQFDMTKVPDVYDMIQYDCLHNSHINVQGMTELYYLTREFADCVVPQEFGIYRKDKRILGSTVCDALLEKIKTDLISNTDMSYSLDHSHADDLAINSLGRSVRTRLYFTSESHLHSILNVLKCPKDPAHCAFCPAGLKILDNTPELSYLTQVVIRVFCNREDPSKVRCEIYFSAGANRDAVKEEKSPALAPYVQLNSNISHEELVGCLDAAIAAARERGDSIIRGDSFADPELASLGPAGTSHDESATPKGTPAPKSSTAEGGVVGDGHVSPSTSLPASARTSPVDADKVNTALGSGSPSSAGVGAGTSAGAGSNVSSPQRMTQTRASSVSSAPMIGSAFNVDGCDSSWENVKPPTSAGSGEGSSGHKFTPQHRTPTGLDAAALAAANRTDGRSPAADSCTSGISGASGAEGSSAKKKKIVSDHD